MEQTTSILYKEYNSLPKYGTIYVQKITAKLKFTDTLTTDTHT